MLRFDSTILLRNKQPADRLRVAVTGHIRLGDAATVNFVASSFASVLRELAAAQPGGVVAISGLAAGADSLFAEAALAQGIPLEAGIAAADMEAAFAPGLARQHYQWLYEQCQQVYQLPFTTRSEEAYMALGHWLVDSCDLLVAAWNGQPAAGLGGTGDVVAYAQQQRRPVLHIHTLQHTITMVM